MLLLNSSTLITLTFFSSLLSMRFCPPNLSHDKIPFLVDFINTMTCTSDKGDYVINQK